MKHLAVEKGLLLRAPFFFILFLALCRTAGMAQDSPPRLPSFPKVPVYLEEEGPFGADVRGIVPTADGWVLWTEDAGPYRLDAGSDRWIGGGNGLPISNGRTEVASIASAAGRPGLVAAALLDGWIFLSEDGGLSWELAGLVPAHDEVLREIVFHPGDPSRLLATTRHNLFLSEDGGATWRRLLRSLGLPFSDTPIQIVDVIPDRLQPGRALIATRDGGTLLTENWGHDVRWVRGSLPGPVDAAALDPTFGSIAYAAAGGDLYRSMDGGETWDVVTWSHRGVLGRVLDLAVDCARPTRLLALGPRHLMVSEDGGYNWVSLDLPPGERPKTIAVHPLGADRDLLLGTTRGVWRSDDAGRSWRSVSLGLQDVTVLDLAPRGEFGEIWAATDRGLAVFDGSRREWSWRTELGERIPEQLVFPDGSGRARWFLCEDGVWTIGLDGLPSRLAGFRDDFRATSAVWWRDALWAAGIGGDSIWVATLAPDGEADHTSIAPVDPDMIDPWLHTDPCGDGRLLLGYSFLLQSADGAMWTPMDLPDEVSWVWDVTRTGTCGDVLIATNRGLFLKDGPEWVGAGPGEFEIQEVVGGASPGHWLVRASGVVYGTFDWGESWVRPDLPRGQVSLLTRDPRSDRVLVGLQDEGVRAFRVEPTAVGPRVEPIHVSPNPFRDEAAVSLRVLEATGPIELRIYSVFGDLVRTARIEGSFAAGREVGWTWDGASDDGQPAAAGMYVFRATIGGRPYGGKVLHMR